MSNLDDDLAEAAVAPDPPPVALPTAATPPKKKGNIGLLVGLVLMAGAVLALVLSFKDAAVYAKSVDQVTADRAALAGRALRVEGNLVKGSLVHQEQPCEFRFRIEEKGQQLPVRYGNCVVPDTFRDVPGVDVRVTVEGKLTADGGFEASLVMAKCPSKYEMKDRAAKGEAMPHGAPVP
ncbi:MAG: cytochrome c maturation protein CcmE [Polyangiaceae bacterium]|nr:cytochrome c maturation protein CcmE [Polyangiaceae bacterium]